MSLNEQITNGYDHAGIHSGKARQDRKNPDQARICAEETVPTNGYEEMPSFDIADEWFRQEEQNHRNSDRILGNWIGNIWIPLPWRRPPETDRSVIEIVLVEGGAFFMLANIFAMLFITIFRMFAHLA